MTAKEELAAIRAIALDNFCRVHGLPVALAGMMSDFEGEQVVARIREEGAAAGHKLAEEYLKIAHPSAAE